MNIINDIAKAVAELRRFRAEPHALWSATPVVVDGHEVHELCGFRVFVDPTLPPGQWYLFTLEQHEERIAARERLGGVLP